MSDGLDDASARPGYTELTPIFWGSYAEVIALRSALAAEGYESFFPDELTKTFDPFVTGANALNARLLAPTGKATEIVEAIRRIRASGALRAEADSSLEEDEEEVEISADLVEKDLESLGKRIRWCAILMLFCPVGFSIGLVYFYLLRKSSRRPPSFRMTLLAFLWCCALTAAFVVIVISSLLAS